MRGFIRGEWDDMWLVAFAAFVIIVGICLPIAVGFYLEDSHCCKTGICAVVSQQINWTTEASAWSSCNAVLRNITAIRSITCERIVPGDSGRCQT